MPSIEVPDINPRAVIIDVMLHCTKTVTNLIDAAANSAEESLLP